MPVPDFQSLMLPVLKALSGSAEVSISKVRDHVATAEMLIQTKAPSFVMKKSTEEKAGIIQETLIHHPRV